MRAVLADLHISAVFLTRLPWPHLPAAPPPLARSMWAFPLVGGLVGGIAAAVLTLAEQAGLGAWPASLLAVAAVILVTGGLHEDGLGDVADGFGGVTRQRRLEIMRDSRVGTYGVLALVISIGLRWAALAEMDTLRAAVVALIVAAVLGRASMPLMLLLGRPARPDGLGAGAGQVSGWTVLAALALAAAVALWLVPVLAVPLVILTVALCLAASLIAHRRFGGYTGDVLGAAAQVVEIAILLVLVAQ